MQRNNKSEMLMIHFCMAVLSLSLCGLCLVAARCIASWFYFDTMFNLKLSKTLGPYHKVLTVSIILSAFNVLNEV